ncbi:sugar transferase [Nocardioides currus]|uniref:Sugar transferase n=1 Tax=Nocardioides currus TaxID=2133958 RepID=A0A2R7Z310_9ACTN|nr:sugar transferase [Nocardioides currus]PUA83018.1 sugar transferase [Nocardioides currus]
MLKRGIDVLGSVVGSVLLSPVLVAIAALIRLREGAPVFFRQERVGLDGRTFRILKFRTMRVSRPGAPEVTVAGDDRVTDIGRVLRRTKLDELPQLLNVVRGEMSLVGPRPEVAQYVADWPDDVRRVVLSVRPGITDPASLEHFDEEAVLATYDDPIEAYRTIVTPRKLEMYQRYVATQSLVGDLRIIIATVRRAFT